MKTKNFKAMSDADIISLIESAKKNADITGDILNQLAAQAFFHQMRHQKAHVANNVMKHILEHEKLKSYSKQVEDFLNHFCHFLRKTDKNDKNQNVVFTVKTGTKPHGDPLEAEKAALAAVADLPDLFRWSKAKKKASKSIPKPVDFFGVLNKLAKDVMARGVDASQSASYHAFTTFLSVIESEKTLTDLSADIKAEMAFNSINKQVTAKPAQPKKAAKKAIAA